MELQETTSVPAILEGIQMFLFSLGFLFIFIWLLFMWLGQSAYSWPKTKGVVLISEELQISRSPRFVPRILYRYSVNNKAIKSRIIFIGHFLTYTPIDYCREIIARYPIDAEVTVYYHPGFPKLSVLEPGSNKKLTNSLITKLVTIGVCIIITSPEIIKILINLAKN
jgi:hypothetical protein